MKAPLSWTPVWRGSTYCSPACGAGCTRKAYNLATKNAKALAERLGPGWRSNVWQNMGWHYEVVFDVIQNGLAKVGSNGLTSIRMREYQGADGGNFTCYLNLSRQVVTRGETPEAALKLALQTARAWSHAHAAELAFCPPSAP